MSTAFPNPLPRFILPTERIAMRKWLMIAAAAVWCCHAADVGAHSHRQKGFEIVHPWCFATVDAAATTTAVYMLIKNRGRRPDRLIGATSPNARTIELRAPAASSGDGTRVVAAVALPRGREVALKRNGPHLVLSGLDKPLSPYESFPMTLIFKRAGKIDIEVLVEEAATVAKP
jgi:periplasmic copper chaperone A